MPAGAAAAPVSPIRASAVRAGALHAWHPALPELAAHRHAATEGLHPAQAARRCHGAAGALALAAAGAAALAVASSLAAARPLRLSGAVRLRTVREALAASGCRLAQELIERRVVERAQLLGKHCAGEGGISAM